MLGNEKTSRKPINNTVVGQVRNKVILSCTDYPGQLFFCPMDEGTAEVGEHLADATLYPLMLLSSAEEREVRELYG